jgi:hypothetical protein
MKKQLSLNAANFSLIIVLLFVFSATKLHAQKHALEFDGIDDYISIPDDPSFDISSSTVTIEAWIYPTNLSGRHVVFSTRNQNSSGSFQLEVGSVDDRTNAVAVSGLGTWIITSPSNAIKPNEWTHIAFASNGYSYNNRSLYINGVKVSSYSQYYWLANNNDIKTIGCGTNGGSFFQGKIDRLRFWNVERTQQQIQDNMLTGLNGDEAGLQAWYKMDEGSGSTTADSSLNTNIGTLKNSPSWIPDAIVPRGDGSASNPYKVSSGFNLFWVSGNTDAWSQNFEQTADIEATGNNPWAVNGGFSPIGSENTGSQPFSGTYDGKNFVIKGLTVNGDGTSINQGMFGFTKNAEIKQVRLGQADITGNENTGGLIGKDSASVVSNCFVSGDVTGNVNTGALIGLTNATSVVSCFTLGQLNGTDHTGGLTGQSAEQTTIQNSHAGVTVNGDSIAGGLTGSLLSSSTVENCYAIGEVLGNKLTGGLTGKVDASNIAASFWNTETSGLATSAGGTGKTTTEMQTGSTYISAGWDFVGETGNGSQDLWDISNTKNTGYPALTNTIYPPHASVNNFSNITESSAIANVEVLYFDNLNLNDHGVCWNTSGNPDTEDNHTSDGSSTQPTPFATSLTGLSPLTEYYVRPFLITDLGLIYGKEKKFTSGAHFAGSGTEADPYQISSFEEFQTICTYDSYWNAHFIQTDEIDAAGSKELNGGAGLTPIGNQSKNFTGSYDGDNYVIKNIWINRPSSDESIGLFGYPREATFSNINLQNHVVKGKDGTGGLIGTDSASVVSHCTINATITAQAIAGGLIGQAEHTTIQNCKTSGNLSGYSFSGGIAGKAINQTTIENCHASVEVGGDSSVGGLVGTLQSSSSVSESYSTGKVTGNSNVGGLIGSISSATTANSFWDTESSGLASSADGTGLPSADMQTTATFTDAGWDFSGETTNGTNDYWSRNDTIFNGYPYLKNLTYLPEAIVESTTAITDSSAVVHIQISMRGTSEVTQHGICWNLSGSPTINDSIAQENTSTGTTTVSLPVKYLKAITTYYVRPYLITEDGISYGKETSFKSSAHFNGAGTYSEPYEIATLQDLRMLSENSIYWGSNYVFKQTADIDARETKNWNNGAGFSPIGSGYFSPFSGPYYGDGHYIDSLYINREDAYYIGLFGYVGSGSIRNLGLRDINISGDFYVGAIAGYSQAYIFGCFSSGSIHAKSRYGGGICGNLYYITTISHSYSTADVTGGDYIGGITGNTYSSSSKVVSSYSTGSITSNSGGTMIGGLIGNTSGTITTSFWNTDTLPQSTSNGGIGLTTEEMRDYEKYFNAGWDLLNETTNGTYDYWGIDQSEAENDGFPFLAWQGYQHRLKPVVSTDSITNVAMNSTVIHSTFVSAGDSSITQYGICYSADTIPSINDLKTEQGSSPATGPFSSTLSGLHPGVTYYARAYATSAVNTSYGDTISFSFPPKELLITGSFTPNDKVYDGNTNTTIQTNNLSLYGIVGNDVVSLDTIEIELDTAAVGNNIQVFIKRATLKGTHADNYTVSLDGAPIETANITAKTVSIDGFFSIQTKTYDANQNATISASDLFLDGIIDEDNVSLSNVVTSFVQADAGDGVNAQIASADLIGADSANYTLSLTGSPTSTGNIKTKTITLGGSFTVDNKTYDGTETATVASNSLTPEGVLGTEEVSVTDVIAEFALADVDDALDVFIITASLSGADSDNYSISLNGAPASTGDITPKELTISGSFIPENKVYDGDTVATIGTNSLLISEIIENDDVALTNTKTAFNQAVVDTNIGVSISEASLAGPDADNYTLSLTGAPTASGNITPKELTIGGSFMVDSKTYDNSPSATISSNALFLEGIVGTDGVTMTGLEAQFSQSLADNGITVMVSQVSLAGPDMANYTVTLAGAPVTTANIYPHELTISGSFTAENKVYDDSADATISQNSLTLSGIIGSDAVTLSHVTAEFSQTMVGDGLTIILSGADLSGTAASNYSLSLTNSPQATADITPKPLTVSGSFAVNDKPYDGTTSALMTSNSLTLSGIEGSDNVTLSGLSIDFPQANIGTELNVSITDASLSGVDAANYSLSLSGAPAQVASIVPKEVSVTGSFTISNKIYDGTQSASMAANNLSLSAVVGTEDVSLSNVVAQFAQENVGTSIAVNLTSASLEGTDLDNYTLSLTGAPSSTGNITTKQLTIGGSFAVSDKVFDGTTPASVSTNALNLSGVLGTDDVNLTNLQTAFNQSDVGSALPVSISSAEISGVDVANYGLSLSGAPTTTGNITPATLTISGTFSVDSKTYDGTTDVTVATTSLGLDGAIGTDAVGLSNVEAAFDQADAGSAINANITNASLSGSDAGNYTLSLTGAPTTTGDIHPASLSVSGTLSAQTKVYDGTTEAVLASASLSPIGVIGNDVVDISNVAVEFALPQAGTGKAVLIQSANLTGTDAGNYTLSLGGALEGTGDITPKPLTISGSFAVSDKPYDGTTSALMASNSLTLSGIEGSDNVTLSGLSIDFPQADIGTDLNVSITDAFLTGIDAQNYSLSLTAAPSQVASIVPKELTIIGSFTVSSKPYDGTKTAYIGNNNLELTGIINSEDVVLTDIQPEYTQIDTGEGITVTITNAMLDGNDAANYTLSLSGAPVSSGNITTNELTIKGSFTVNNKEYDGVTLASMVNNNLELEGVAENHNVELTNVEVEFNHADIGTDILVSIIHAEISGVDTGNYNLSLINAPTARGNINPITLTITGTFNAANKVYDGTTSASMNDHNLNLEGLLENHSVGITDIEIEFSDLSAGDNIEVFISNASLLGRDAAKYVVSLEESPTAIANIEPKQLTIVGSFSAESKIYDGTASATISSNDLSIEGVIDGDQVVLGDIEVQFGQSEPGSNIIVSITEAPISGNEASNYIVSFIDAPTAVADVMAEYILTIIIEGNGLVNVNDEPYSNEITVTEGTTINLDAIADEDWQFNAWSGGDWNSQNASESIVIDTDMTITAEFSTTTDIHENDSTIDIAIWPNPFSEQVNIKSKTELANIKVVNISGEVVFTTDNPDSSIILDELTTGTYLMIIEDKNGNRMTKKILKK